MRFELIRPWLHGLEPERAHRLAILGLKFGLAPSASEPDDKALATRVFGLEFRNPIGMSAGFDKEAEVCDALLAVGFGFVEAGTVTPKPQPGNPKPRLFRLSEDEAVINRLGFNSGGLGPFVENLKRARGRTGIVGANVGKNKDSERAVADYVAGIEAVCPYADYLVCNISSPNTPGLRSLQARGPIRELLGASLAARSRRARSATRPPPLLVKIAPDMTDDELEDVAAVARETGVDGIIVANTTVARPRELKSRFAAEAGGLSGKPLMAASTECLRTMYRLLDGAIPLVGVGGVASGADAYAKIRAGASLVQLYSALVFHGPELVARIKRELAALLKRDGFPAVAQAVGADFR